MTTGRQLWFESTAERDNLLCLDFEPSVWDARTQPFYANDGDGEPICPDIMVASGGGPLTVIEVKPTRQSRREREQRRFQRMKAVCDGVGWTYEVRSEPSRVLVRNLRFCRGSRPETETVAEFAPMLVDRCRGGCEFAKALPTGEHRSTARSVALALIWAGVLVCDLDVPLDDETELTTTRRYGDANRA